jgi:acetyl-CoA synthetase
MGKREKTVVGRKSKVITSMMNEKRVFKPLKEIVSQSYIKNMKEYKKIYNESIKHPDKFWAKMSSELLVWDKKWTKVCKCRFTGSPKFNYFINGKLNPTKTCLDQHLNNWRRNKAAIIWQGEPDDDFRIYTYQQLFYEVNKFANVLKKKGVKKGDTVVIYLPMIPELPIAMLACARIGAIHSVVFGGFSVASLRNRIKDCRAKYVITADGGYRRGNIVPLKANINEAISECPTVDVVIVVNRTDSKVNMMPGRDFWWHEEMKAANIKPYCEPEQMDSEDTLYILYTSGSTGKPKGQMHSIGGYLTYTALTLKWVFNIKEEDVWWCTADIGWVTGHSYIVYGPLALGATTLMFEGTPDYPCPDKFWQIVEKYRVTQFYTAPTAIRALMRHSEEWPFKHDLSSLQILGTVGEPINPEAWMWYHRVIGKERLPIMDTYWQTETGGFLITPLLATPLKPGSATMPFFGIVPQIFKEDGTPTKANEGGYLVIKKPWPAITRGIYGDSKRYKKTYFNRFPGTYFTSDSARKDKDGYYWLMGRIDDVINVSGHRIGTAEIESALVSNSSVAEAAVVAFPHPIKGEGIYAFVTVKAGIEPTDELNEILKRHVRTEIGPIAQPDIIQFTNALPKTRSGKIMRRILKTIAKGNLTDLGDISTLADPTVVEKLFKERQSISLT